VGAQLLTENLLTQAAIHWYLAAPVAFALAMAAREPTGARTAAVASEAAP
jgi:hypothetical protein